MNAALVLLRQLYRPCGSARLRPERLTTWAKRQNRFNRRLGRSLPSPPTLTIQKTLEE